MEPLCSSSAFWSTQLCPAGPANLLGLVYRREEFGRGSGDSFGVNLENGLHFGMLDLGVSLAVLGVSHLRVRSFDGRVKLAYFFKIEVAFLYWYDVDVGIGTVEFLLLLDEPLEDSLDDG